MDNMGNELVLVLKDLEVDQIVEVQKRLKEMYPDDKLLSYQCQMAMAKTLDDKAQETVHIYDFMCSVLQRDKKSAPNGAATPNGASNQITKH